MQIRLTDIGAESGRLDSSADQCPNSYSDWEEIMVKISVLYPHKDRSPFNMNYYLNNHIPMVRQKLGAACKGMAVEQGLAGGMPGRRWDTCCLTQLSRSRRHSRRTQQRSWPIFLTIRQSSRSFKSAKSSCRNAATPCYAVKRNRGPPSNAISKRTRSGSGVMRRLANGRASNARSLGLDQVLRRRFVFNSLLRRNG